VIKVNYLLRQKRYALFEGLLQDLGTIDSDDDDYLDGIVKNVNNNDDADINDDDNDENTNENDDEDNDNDNNDDNDEDDDNDDDHDEDNDNDDDNNDDNDNGDDDDPGAEETIHPRALREMKCLQAFFNDEATEYVRDALGRTHATETADDDNVESVTGSTASNHRSGRETDDEASHQQTAGGSLDGDQDLASAAIDFLPHFAFYTKNHVVEPFDVSQAFEQRLIEPTTFREAYDHPDPEQGEKWRTAIQKEFHDMNRRGVWRKVRRSSIPKGRRCIRSKWVFKIKRDGVFRARLVACGYSQIPGVDFTENFAPVVNDVTWRILIVAMLVWKLDAIIIDAETAFLHGDLEEEIYVDLPVGMTGFKDECLLLLKSIYGLVQGARQWWKKLISILKKIGFKGGNADSCLMIRRDDNGLVITSVYVDDNFCVGHRKALGELVEELKKEGLSIKMSNKLDDYLSCTIKLSDDKTKAWIGQPHLIDKLKSKFGELVQGMQAYKTPGTPGQCIV